MKTFLQILLVAIALINTACNTSLLYDPTLRMPTQRVRTSEVQASAAWGMLPETRPGYVAQRRMQHAVMADARAGLSQRVSLQARTWIGIDQDDEFDNVRWGLGGSFLYAIDTADFGWRTYIQPSVGFSAIGNTINGFGGTLNYIVYTPQWNSLQPYFSVGGILGFSSESLHDWGLAPTFHIGSSWEFLQKMGVCVELASVIQINMSEKVTHPILVPTVGFYIRN
ncbi:MAG: hypothetical protein HQ472_07930 [Ignavibacteria bacterium]|nr:hypothetical protein [Ignavibacteria bacterium]